MKTPLTAALILSAILFHAACSTTDRLIEGGNYDKAITRIAGKLEGKARKKTDDVKALEHAFNSVNASDMREVERLSATGMVSDLERAVEILAMVERRQDMLAPFLPMVSRDGYRARFQLADVRSFNKDIRHALAGAIFRDASELMASARMGDREAGRLAFDMYEKLIALEGNRSQLRQLKAEAHQLGITTIAVNHEVNGYIPHASFIESRLKGLQRWDDSAWIEIVNADDHDGRADLRIDLYIQGVRLGAASIRSEETPRSRTLSDGWDYVLDQNGNVLKDSSGNDVKVDRIIEVGGVAVKTIQERDGEMTAVFEVTDLHTNALVRSRPLTVSTSFRHTGRSYYGDARALRESERVVEGLVPFPDDTLMIDRLIERLGPVYRKEIRKLLNGYSSV